MQRGGRQAPRGRGTCSNSSQKDHHHPAGIMEAHSMSICVWNLGSFWNLTSAALLGVMSTQRGHGSRGYDSVLPGEAFLQAKFFSPEPCTCWLVSGTLLPVQPGQVCCVLCLWTCTQPSRLHASLQGFCVKTAPEDSSLQRLFYLQVCLKSDICGHAQGPSTSRVTLERLAWECVSRPTSQGC